MQFGISTHLFHDVALKEDHLREAAGHGFDRIELFACTGHFDYRDPAAIADLGRWLAATGTTLHSVHCPIVASLAGNRWGTAYNNAAVDQAVRQEAVREGIAALEIARTIPFEYLVVHLGVPDFLKPTRADNDREQAKRSVEQLHAAAAHLGVRLALEVIPNTLSTPDLLVDLIESDIDERDVGICLDFGHAFLGGDLGDAIETTAGHIMTTHVHDNRGKTDDHLLPFDGVIDWASAMMSVQKVGYEGTLLFELQGSEEPGSTLARAAGVRRRLEGMLVDWTPMALEKGE